MNPDSQNPTDEPTQNSGMGDMPQAPTTGTGDDQGTTPMPPAGGDNGGSEAPAPEAPEETPAEGGEAPAAPAPEEGDKEDGGKW
jgi:hypothetical protein